LRGALHGLDVEEIALENFGAECAELVGAIVDRAHKGAHGNAALEQHFGDVPAGLALAAAGRGCHEYGVGHG